jgi:hypothetical protein
MGRVLYRGEAVKFQPTREYLTGEGPYAVRKVTDYLILCKSKACISVKAVSDIDTTVKTVCVPMKLSETCMQKLVDEHTRLERERYTKYQRTQ